MNFLRPVMQVLNLFVRVAILATAIWSTYYLVTHGHSHIWLVWFFFAAPGFFLPFWTPMWFVYLLLSIAEPTTRAISNIETSNTTLEARHDAPVLIEGSVQWHDENKNYGYPNYGTVVADPSGMYFREDDYEDGGPPPDNWYIGWGYIKGCNIQEEDGRISVPLVGFNSFIYPKSELDRDKWVEILSHYSRSGGQNIRKRL
jgi:hypothetical protein